MKLFDHLSSDQQIAAMHYHMSLILEDIINEEFDWQSDDEADVKLKAKIDAILEGAKTLEEGQKVQKLIDDTEVNGALHDYALSFARSTYYSSTDEHTVCIDCLTSDIEEMEKEKEASELPDPSKHRVKHSVN